MGLQLLDKQVKGAAAFERARDTFIENAGKISANMLGMVNKVGGQIYALLFLSRQPLSLDDISAALKLSKGNVSVNIRMLEDEKLVRKVWVKGNRKDFYEVRRDYPREFLRGFFDKVREGIEESLRVIRKCQGEFEAAGQGVSGEPAEDVRFILAQLTLLASFYEAASRIFEDFYQGKKVDIDLLRMAILG